MLDHKPEFAFLVVWKRNTFQLSVEVFGFEFAPAVMRSSHRADRGALVATTGCSKKTETFLSDHFFKSYIQLFEDGIISPNNIPICIIDDQHIIYFIHDHIEDVFSRYAFRIHHTNIDCDTDY